MGSPAALRALRQVGGVGLGVRGALRRGMASEGRGGTASGVQGAAVGVSGRSPHAPGPANVPAPAHAAGPTARFAADAPPRAEDGRSTPSRGVNGEGRSGRLLRLFSTGMAVGGSAGAVWYGLVTVDPRQLPFPRVFDSSWSKRRQALEAAARASPGFRPRTLEEMRQSSARAEVEAGRAAETSLGLAALLFAVLRVTINMAVADSAEEMVFWGHLKALALIQLFLFATNVVSLLRHAAQRFTARVCEGMDASLRRAAAACAPQCLSPLVLEASGVSTLDSESKRLLRSLGTTLCAPSTPMQTPIVVATTARACAAGNRAVFGRVRYDLGPSSLVEIQFKAMPAVAAGATGELSALDWAGGTREAASQMAVDVGAALPLPILHVTRTLLGRPPGIDPLSADAEQSSALKNYVDALHALGERKFGPQGSDSVWIPTHVRVILPGDALALRATLTETTDLRGAVRRPKIIARVWDDLKGQVREANESVRKVNI